MTQPHCGVCHLELPTSATQPWCDDHEDGHAPPPPLPPDPGRPVRVVHNGKISKSDGGFV